MTDKPLDCVGVQANLKKPGRGKHDFITFEDKEHKIAKARIKREGSITLTYVVTPVEEVTEQ